MLTHETEEGKEAAGEEETDYDIGQAVHAQVETTAAHQSAPRAENQDGGHQYLLVEVQKHNCRSPKRTTC